MPTPRLLALLAMGGTVALAGGSLALAASQPTRGPGRGLTPARAAPATSRDREQGTSSGYGTSAPETGPLPRGHASPTRGGASPGEGASLSPTGTSPHSGAVPSDTATSLQDGTSPSEVDASRRGDTSSPGTDEQGAGRLSPTTAPPVGARAWTPPVTPLVVLRPFQAPVTRWSPGHRGVDLAARPGQVVVAPHAAVVAFAGMVAGRPVLTLDHGTGLRTTYEPVLPGRRPGERLRGGDPIGTLAPGDHCAQACLHWGALRDGSYLDPMSLLAAEDVVLLPLPQG